MNLRLLLLLLICSTSFAVIAQTTSGSIGTYTTDPDSPAEETFNLKTTQKLEITGLIQARYQLFEDSAKIDAFDLRRARLAIRGDVGAKIGYRLQLEFINTPKILDAVFTYKPFEYINLNVGQSKTPYSYDNYYSPFTQITISRTQIDNALSFRENDLYGNQNGRDLGAWLTGKFNIGEEGAKRPIVEYVLGIYNGAGINVADNNNFKDFGAALRVSPVKDLWISGRAYHGVHTKLFANSDSTADRIRLGGDLTYKYKSFLIEAEYLIGKDRGAGQKVALERSGYYFTLGYVPIKDKLSVIARFDNYDSNTSTGLNSVTRYVLAANWYFNKTSRIQLEYNIVGEEDTDNPINNNLFAIQFQAGF